MTLTGAKGLVIDGCGAALIIRNLRLGFLRLLSCERVLVKCLSIDYDPLPFTQGFVESIEGANPIWIIARQNGRSAFAADFSSDITFQGITVFASPTVVFALFMSTRSAVLSCHTQIKPGRWISVNADVVHAHRNRIVDCPGPSIFIGSARNVSGVRVFGNGALRVDADRSVLGLSRK